MAEPKRSAEPDDTRRRVLSDEVAEVLQARILDGTWGAGDRLPPERELAEQLRVNRSSVREALKKLEELRLVEIQQGSGIRVRRLDQANLELVRQLLFRDGRPHLGWIRDLLELREVMLVGLVRLCLERATQEELERFVGIVERAGDSDVSDEEFADLSLAMQDAASQMTHNRVVLLLWNSLRRFLSQAPFDAARRRIAEERHELTPALRRFAHAAGARDVDTAQRVVREILRKLERAILAVFSNIADPRSPGETDSGS